MRSSIRTAVMSALLSVATLAGLPGMAGASQTKCPALFTGGQAPGLLKPALAEKTIPLCYNTFSVLHSGQVREPLYSAEHLTAQAVDENRGESREGIEFFADPGIPADQRAELGDYRGQIGIDRGHLANWADTGDPATFTLANIVPQDANNNRNLWKWIEMTTRNQVTAYGEAYVVSGPIFQGELKWMNGRVAVPTGLFKAIYIPSTQKTGVYVVDNRPGTEWRQISVSELRNLIGIDVFPSLAEPVKAQVPELPEPRARPPAAASRMARERRPN